MEAASAVLALAELCGVRYESLDEAVNLVVDVLVWRVQLRATWGSRAAESTRDAFWPSGFLGTYFFQCKKIASIFNDILVTFRAPSVDLRVGVGR